MKFLPLLLKKIPFTEFVFSFEEVEFETDKDDENNDENPMGFVSIMAADILDEGLL